MKLREMNRDGCQITVDGQVKALRNWFARGDLHYRRLAAEMQSFEPSDAHWAHGRNADALVQKLRKAGVIEYIDGSWHLTDQYADSIDAKVQSWA